jgi:ABC-type sugar transport system ATPase subunit
VLLDEPRAGLDERTYSRLLDELPQILAAFKATTLLVTHNRDEALRVAQNLVILVDGKVRGAGHKRELAANPKVTEVAEVLGYSVLGVNGARVAVPQGALRLGLGELEFWVIVDDVLDLVESTVIVGRIGDARVHVTLSCRTIRSPDLTFFAAVLGVPQYPHQPGPGDQENLL